jgi:hypothetical protein
MTDYVVGILQFRVSLDHHSETKLIIIIRIREEQLLLILSLPSSIIQPLLEIARLIVG